MKLPRVQGTIERRILVNFRVDPAALGAELPPPFAPKLIHGVGIGGICLIRLARMRPRFVPSIFGLSSENAAHRIAVEWETPEGLAEGVFVPRRDTSSRLNSLVGGRAFAGEYHLARFRVVETETEFSVAFESRDGTTQGKVAGRIAAELPKTSVFSSLAEASEFFESGSLGYSVTQIPGQFDGLELKTQTWTMKPLEVSEVDSSFFTSGHFPPGSVEFDCALVMQEIEHEWVHREDLCCSPSAV